MTELPTTGGSYTRDPKTGSLLRASLITDQGEEPERNLLELEAPTAMAEAEPAAKPVPQKKEPK